MGGMLVPGMREVGRIQMFTEREVEADSGEDVELKCIFSANCPVSLKTIAVTWYFQPLLPGPKETAFFYLEKPYPPPLGRFKRHAVWSGDVMKYDTSITLKKVLQTFSGTYTCHVHNPPNIHSIGGEVVLKVVNKAASKEPYERFMALL